MFKTVKGKKNSNEWVLMVKHNKEFKIGLHFDKSFSQNKIDIIKKHLDAACQELNDQETTNNGH